MDIFRKLEVSLGNPTVLIKRIKMYLFYCTHPIFCTGLVCRLSLSCIENLICDNIMDKNITKWKSRKQLL